MYFSTTFPLFLWKKIQSTLKKHFNLVNEAKTEENLLNNIDRTQHVEK